MIYLHGIIRLPSVDPEPYGTAGEADAPALVRYRGVAGLVSQVTSLPGDDASDELQQMRQLRQEMGRHADILNEAVQDHTLAPVRFGTVFADGESLVGEFLKPCYDQIEDALRRVDGAVEVTLKAEYNRERILQDVARQQPVYSAVSTEGPVSTNLDERIELGRRIVTAIEARRDDDAAQILTTLEPHTREIASRAPGSELIVLNASFLLGRSRMEAFDQEVNRLGTELQDRVVLTCIGPLPPYSFVSLRIEEPC